MPHWLKKAVELLTAETSDLRELALMAGGDPATFYRGVDPQSLDLENQDIDGMEFLSEPSVIDMLLDGSHLNIEFEAEANLVMETKDFVGLIREMGRQEQRLALLLRAILEHREHAVKILETYGKDRAKSANSALVDLTRALREENAQMSFFDETQLNLNLSIERTSKRKRVSDEILAHIIYRPFGRNLPGTRGALLYYMTRYLSDFPKINAFLRSKVEKTHSIFIVPQKQEMLDFLDNPPEHSWTSILGLHLA